jgi:hypothetical protein
MGGLLIMNCNERRPVSSYRFGFFKMFLNKYLISLLNRIKTQIINTTYLTTVSKII